MPQINNSSEAIQQYLNRGGSIDQLLADVKHIKNLINNNNIDNSLSTTTGFYFGDLSVMELFEVDRIPKTIKIIKRKTSSDDEVQSFEAIVLPGYALGTWFYGLYISGDSTSLHLLDCKPIRITEKINGLYGVESDVMHETDAVYSYCVTY